MKPSANLLNKAKAGVLGLFLGTAPVGAATLNLSSSPLFLGVSVDPNVFFIDQVCLGQRGTNYEIVTFSASVAAKCIRKWAYSAGSVENQADFTVAHDAGTTQPGNMREVLVQRFDHDIGVSIQIVDFDRQASMAVSHQHRLY